MEKYEVIQIDCFRKFLTWKGLYKIKFKYEKKAGYRTINSKISVTISRKKWKKYAKVLLVLISVLLNFE